MKTFFTLFVFSALLTLTSIAGSNTGTITCQGIEDSTVTMNVLTRDLDRVIHVDLNYSTDSVKLEDIYPTDGKLEMDWDSSRISLFFLETTLKTDRSIFLSGQSEFEKDDCGKYCQRAEFYGEITYYKLVGNSERIIFRETARCRIDYKI